MTIRKGESWGGPATSKPDLVVDNDRAASVALAECRRDNTPFPVLGVTAGDLCHTLGGTGALQNEFPLDLGEALIDGRHHYFVAHVVAHDRRWRRFAVAMNAQWVGEWNFGPKAHPNDGIVDAYQGALNRFEWRQVRARLPAGAHLPHPRITPTRAKAVAFEFPQPLPVAIDGEVIGPAKHVAVRIIPDALRVIA